MADMPQLRRPPHGDLSWEPAMAATSANGRRGNTTIRISFKTTLRSSAPELPIGQTITAIPSPRQRCGSIPPSISRGSLRGLTIPTILPSPRGPGPSPLMLRPTNVIRPAGAAISIYNWNSITAPRHSSPPATRPPMSPPPFLKMLLPVTTIWFSSPQPPELQQSLHPQATRSMLLWDNIRLLAASFPLPPSR